MREIELTTPGSTLTTGKCRQRGTRTASLVAAVALFGLLTACGSDASNSAASKPSAQDNGGVVAGAEPNAASGEGAAVRYTSSRFHYQVDGPGAMREGTDGSAAYVGGLERLEISVVTGPTAADIRAFAATDVAGLPAAHPSFNMMNQPSVVTISSVAVEKVAFRWTDGLNQVTSKPNALVTVRYYIPRNTGTLAVFTYSIAAARYDPQGADDVATTFKWL